MRSAQPYDRIQLTVEPDSFVLQQYHGPPANDDLTAQQDRTLSLVQVLFKLPWPETEKEVGTDDKAPVLKKDPVEDGQVIIDPVDSNSLSGLADRQRGRISFLPPGSYTRSKWAKDYLIYGCIGLLDLYTGPHFIVVTSIRPLGDIEDKPVNAINKVAVLPMEANEAIRVLDKTAQWINPSTEPVIHTQQDSEQLSSIQEPAAEEEPKEQPIQPVPIKSPKIRFSFLGSRQDKGQQKPTSSPCSISPSNSDLSLQGSAAASSKNPRKISFDVPLPSSGGKGSIELKRDSTGASGSTPLSPPTSPLLSPKPRMTQAGFFAKLKENILEKNPRKPTVDGSIQPRTSTEITTSIESSADHVDAHGVNLVESSCSQSQPTAAESGTPLLKIDRIGADKSENLSTSAPKSPSAFETAEKFVVQSSKQLADWSEEAVSGVFKSSMSFALSKPESATDRSAEGEHAQPTIDALDSGDDEEEQEKHRLLERRVIREISSIFGTGFYFSTNFNLLSSKQNRFTKESRLKENDPLWQQVDKRFWWNEHLLKEFLDIEAHGYILPVMQGYVEIEQCVIEEQPFEFTLISRRSRERSGLRYQRRGIDENGNTANFVETEQLLRIVVGLGLCSIHSENLSSLTETNRSIPLFWSQSPYRLKPIPILERTEEENEEGFKKHVESQMKQYGRQIFINLVEQHGRELIAGSAYTHYVEKLAEPQVKYVEFDFHEQCKGMKYENIERLIKSLETQILELGYCWLTPMHEASGRKGDEPFERLYDQKGVIRTNCMDCLDRTNVVQSAIGRHILNHQLLRLGIASFPDKGLSVYEDFENVFNNVWANNGDAISREYAGTSALKGDFTRTGKRNLQGMINDATNSVARMYQNTFKDYFRQAAIDFLLGIADINVFKKLQTTSFGTAVVPQPILPAMPTPSHEKHVLLSSPDLLAASTRNAIVADGTNVSAALLPSLIPQPPNSQDLPESSNSIEESPREMALHQETWVKIREAAIETSAEIVISPGEENWKGWTFICCSNEISSAFASASSPQGSLEKPASHKKSTKSASAFNSKAPSSKSNSQGTSVFYDEKVVLLTERALYICSYDYEMEKVLEFWRLALEKMTGIDKGEFFLTGQDTSRFGQDPLENYGFAVVYRANAGGETMRVNSGSVRNRRVMGVNRIPLDGINNLGQVLEEEDEIAPISNGQRRQSEAVFSTGDNEGNFHDDSRPAKSLLKGEPKDIRSVRFKIVRHPETLTIPFVTSSGANSGKLGNGLQDDRRTAKDCAEWVAAEIAQARSELVSVAEKGSEAAPGQLRQFGRHHFRSPSEEYNYHSPIETYRLSVPIDLEIRERVLQSIEMSAQLEKDSLNDARKSNKKSKKPFGGFFSSSKSSTEKSPQSSPATPSASSSNKSWLKLLQFGQDSDDESDDSDSQQRPTITNSTKQAAISLEYRPTLVEEGQSAGPEAKPSSNSKRNCNQTVFEKFKLAVKNL
ncbi:hypothetical protein BGX27_003066 [Mortierella sp. AM989]|nr:hypothetical protein BGX27_003066 [Mortierella sp. AM989]